MSDRSQPDARSALGPGGRDLPKTVTLRPAAGFACRWVPVVLLTVFAACATPDATPRQPFGEWEGSQYQNDFALPVSIVLPPHWSLRPSSGFFVITKDGRRIPTRQPLRPSELDRAYVFQASGETYGGLYTLGMEIHRLDDDETLDDLVSSQRNRYVLDYGSNRSVLAGPTAKTYQETLLGRSFTVLDFDVLYFGRGFHTRTYYLAVDGLVIALGWTVSDPMMKQDIPELMSRMVHI